MFNTEGVIEIFQKFSSIAIIISLILSIIIVVIGVLPSMFVTGANIIFFGPINGFIISILGEVLGAYISFIIYRKSLKKGTEKLTEKYKLINNLVNSRGKKAGILIFQGRLLPFMPSGVVTLASAMSEVNGIVFSLATFLGKIPSIALEVLISYQIINIEDNKVDFIITIIVLIMIYFTLRKYKS